MNTIFLDLDDTIADFSGRVNEILGYTPTRGEYSTKEWTEILNHQRIFRHLSLCERADEIVSLCRKIRDTKGYNLLFLTAIPRNDDMPWAFNDKIFWARDYYPDIAVWFGPYSKDKYKHCKPNDILIDDRKSNIDQWNGAGGLGLLHYSADRTIKCLEHYLKEEKFPQ